MRTVTRNISLSEELARFAEREAEAGGFGSVSAYFAELVRQRRQSQIEADVALLSRALATALPGPEPVETIVAATRHARNAVRARRQGTVK